MALLLRSTLVAVDTDYPVAGLVVRFGMVALKGEEFHLEHGTTTEYSGPDSTWAKWLGSADNPVARCLLFSLHSSLHIVGTYIIIHTKLHTYCRTDNPVTRCLLFLHILHFIL